MTTGRYFSDVVGDAGTRPLLLLFSSAASIGAVDPRMRPAAMLLPTSAALSSTNLDCDNLDNGDEGELPLNFGIRPD